MGARQAFAARRKVCNRFVHGQPVVRGVINPRMSTPEEKEGLDWKDAKTIYSMARFGTKDLGMV